MRLIETHAHIYADQFDADREETIERAYNIGVEKILMPNIDHTSIDGMLEVELKHPGQCIPMMGLHPCYVKGDFEKELYIVEDWWNKRDFVAVGEIGLDLHWDKSFFEQQKEAFRIQTNWAKEKKRPVAIHSRESNQELIQLLEEVQDGTLTGVLHCFSGTLEEAKRFVELGLYLGIGGVSTFKKGGHDEILPEIDLRKLVLETDCPYLAPKPHRGKRNEPAYLEFILNRVAEIKNISPEVVADATTANAISLFALNE